MFDLSSDQYSEVVLARKRLTLLNPGVNYTGRWGVQCHRQRQESDSGEDIILVVGSRE